MKKVLTIFLLVCGLQIKAQTIQHFEPSSWWVGMKNTSLQILVHGEKISESQVSLSYAGVKLSKVNRVDNPNYLFLDLIISPATKQGKVKIRFETKSGEKIEQELELFNRKPNSTQRKGYDNSDVIYLIAPDRFANGNSDNDNTANTLEKVNRVNQDGRHGGDIQGIIEHLDYIKDMGFTTIWNMPLAENNQEKFTYHGYAITDFYKIDPRYGNNTLFKEFVKKSNERGLKVIKDIVLNHCGIDHWWMKDLPSKDWINNQGKFTPTNDYHETIEDIYASKNDKEGQVRGWFVPSMPDLNQRNSFMANYLIQNTIWWIEYADLAGLRIDTYPYSEKKFLTEWSKAILDEYPNINMVGEEMSLMPSIVSYWQKGKKNHDGYVSYLPSLMDFPIQNALVESLNEKINQYSNGFSKLYHTIVEDFLYPSPHDLVVLPDNHDMPRFFSQLNENPKLFKMGLVYFLTTRGIPQIYYGTEIGMTSPKHRDDGKQRADFPGGWEGDLKNVFERTNLTNQEIDFLDFTKKLLNWRKSASAIHYGKMMHFAPKNGVYSYFRYNEKEKYWIIFNKNEKEVSMDLKRYNEILPENASFFDILENTEYKNGILVPANAFKILKVN